MDGLTLSNIILFSAVAGISITQGDLYDRHKLDGGILAPWLAQAFCISRFIIAIGCFIYLILFTIYYSFIGAIVCFLISPLVFGFFNLIFVAFMTRLMISIFGLVIAPICYFYLITGLPL
jgi:hypothetical protein